MRLRGLSSVLTNQPRRSCGSDSKASGPRACFPFDRGFATAEVHHMGLDEGSSDFCLLRYCGHKMLTSSLSESGPLQATAAGAAIQPLSKGNRTTCGLRRTVPIAE